MGAFVWLAANGLYIDMRRKGRGGFARILFFFMGMPATWLWLFLVSEGKARELPVEDRDDFDEILAQIKREKALESGEPDDRPPADGGSEPGVSGS